MHRSEHRHRRRHHRDHRGSHRHRRRHRDDRRHRVHRDRRRVHRERRRVHRDRWAWPSVPASHRGWGEEACCRGWDEVRLDPVRDGDRPDLGPDDRHRPRCHRHRDADLSRDGLHLVPGRDAKAVRRVLHSNRGCYRPAVRAGRAWVHRDVRPEPDVTGEPQPELLLRRRPGPPALRERENSWPVLPVRVHWERVRASTGPEPAQRGAEPGLPWAQGPAAVHRAWRRWTALPEHLHCWWVPVPGVLRPALPVMVVRPGRCLRRMLIALRRYRRGRPSLGRTGEVAGPRGPQRSTTQI